MSLSMKFIFSLVKSFNDFLTWHVQLTVECLTAPLLLHLGEYNLVLDFVGILTDIADCNLVYFIFFLVMSIKAFQSNFSFQVFFTNLFKNYSFHVNSVGFLFYLDSLFSMFKDTFIFLTAQIKKKWFKK